MTAVSLLSWQTWNQVSSGTLLPWLFNQPGSLLKPSYARLYSYLHSPSVTLWSCVHCVTQTNSSIEKHISRAGCYVLFPLFNWLWDFRGKKSILKQWNQTGVLKANIVAEFPWPFCQAEESWPDFHWAPALMPACFEMIGFLIYYYLFRPHLWWPLNLTRHNVGVRHVKHLQPECVQSNRIVITCLS